VKRRVAPQALKRLKDRVRVLTRRSAGRSLAGVCEDLGPYLAGWKAYFRLAETPRIFAALDKWIRHRLRALQLKHWKRGTTICRELRARGMDELGARRVAANGRRWWRNSAMAINRALPNALFDKLGVPRLAT
jgi:RNA-directed DNA polymerase